MPVHTSSSKSSTASATTRGGKSRRRRSPRAGLRTVQTIGIPADDLDLSGVEAVVVALKSRSIPAAEAVARTRAAEAWLRGRGAAHVLFKICSTFDSSPETGSIGRILTLAKAVFRNPWIPIVGGTPALDTCSAHTGRAAAARPWCASWA